MLMRAFTFFFRAPCHLLKAVVLCSMMHVASGVFANAKIQCEESVSSNTPQTC